MPYDYTDAPPHVRFELIPHGTIATVSHENPRRRCRRGRHAQARRSGDCEMLDLEFAVVDGPYKGRKFWEYFDLGRHDRRARQGCRRSAAAR